MASRGHSASYGFNPYHADEKEPTAAAASGRGSGEEGPPIAREGMTRLPKLEFIRILSRDPLSFDPYNVEALRGLVQEVRPNAPERVLRMVVDAFNEEMKEQFSAFQIWVLDEHAEKGYVEVPEWFVEETEEARRRIGDHIDVHLPERHFTTVVEDDGTEKLVFRFKEKAGYELKFNKGSTVMSFSADLEPELRPAFAELLRDCSGSERYKSSVADKKKLTAAVLASGHRSDTDEGPAAAKREGMTRLPREELIQILYRDPRSIAIAPYDVESLRRLAQEERPNVPEWVLHRVSESYNEGMRNKFIAFQCWVCGELGRKGYVELPDEFFRDREEARRRQGGQVDMYLPDRYFTTVEDRGKKKLVFSFTEERAASESKFNNDNIFLTYCANPIPELAAVYCNEDEAVGQEREGQTRHEKAKGETN